MVLFIVSPHVYSVLYSIRVQFYRPLPPGGNLFAVYKYHIVSNVTQGIKHGRIPWNDNLAGCCERGNEPLGSIKYEGWNFNSGNYLFTTDTK